MDMHFNVDLSKTQIARILMRKDVQTDITDSSFENLKTFIEIH